MLDPSTIQLAKAAAARYGLDAALVCAVIEQESGGNTWATRFEPGFYEGYVVPLAKKASILPRAPLTGATGGPMTTSEMMRRAFSWGMMQVMGQTAREAGFTAPLPSLCDPATGIAVGCQVLAKKLAIAIEQLYHFYPDFLPGSTTLPGTEDKTLIWTRTLDLWNGGSNPNYPAEVLARLKSYGSV